MNKPEKLFKKNHRQNKQLSVKIQNQSCHPQQHNNDSRPVSLSLIFGVSILINPILRFYEISDTCKKYTLHILFTQITVTMSIFAKLKTAIRYTYIFLA